MAQPTDELLETRKKTHGDFTHNAAFTQGAMDLAQAAPNWPRLSPVQREAVHMILHKIARALVGNPDESDHFDDIAGYARLVSQRLPRKVTTIAELKTRRKR